MERLKYLDFDLLIERFNDHYRAHVLQSPAGQASAEFVMPFTDEAVENLMLRVGRARRGVRRLESPEMNAAKQFGGKLFDAVFAGDVRGALRSSIDTANREGTGLRVRLRLAGAPELVDLPWEFLYNSTLNRFLALSNKTPLVRYIELPETPRPLKIAAPLRVLVMISSPGDYETLDVEHEWRNLNESLRDLTESNTVVLERLDLATLGALRRKLRQGQYHVLHFIGHGGFDAQSQDGVLVLVDEQGRGRKTSGQYLATVLTDHDSLRLVVLNACEGGRTARNDPFAGVAQSLVQQGIPAVIAMQFEVTDEASITFAHEFYAAVADGYPVDAALGDARGAIFSEVNDLEWGTPVLYLRAPDGVIFAPMTPQERAELERVRFAEEQARLAEEQRVREEQAREQERVAQAQRERERLAELEGLYLAANTSFGQKDLDAAEKALAALFALDAVNASGRELQTKIQAAREQQAAEQARLAEEQRMRDEQARLAEEQARERERLAEIEGLYVAANTSFGRNDFDGAEKALAALLALDAVNLNWRELQGKIQTAREQQAIEQAKLERERRAQEQRAAQDRQLREGQALEQQQKIDKLYGEAEVRFARRDFDGADQALAALLALDAGNRLASELSLKVAQARVQVALEQDRLAREKRVSEQKAAAAPAAQPRSGAPSGLPERASVGKEALREPSKAGFPVPLFMASIAIWTLAFALGGVAAAVLASMQARDGEQTFIATLCIVGPLAGIVGTLVLLRGARASLSQRTAMVIAIGCAAGVLVAAAVTLRIAWGSTFGTLEYEFRIVDFGVLLVLALLAGLVFGLLAAALLWRRSRSVIEG